MRQSTDGDEQRDVGAAQFEHRAVVHATAQQTIARDRPRLRAAVVAVVPDHNTLPHNTTHTHPFNGPLSRTTQVSRYKKGKTNLDFTEARDSEWQWHQLGCMQVCTSLQTDNHDSNPPLSFYRLDALPTAQPTASKH